MGRNAFPAREVSKVVVFERNGYTLYAREQPTRGDKFLTVYFFSKRKPVVGHTVDVPEGYLVAIEKKTGIPFLRKK